MDKKVVTPRFGVNDLFDVEVNKPEAGSGEEGAIKGDVIFLVGPEDDEGRVKGDQERKPPRYSVDHDGLRSGGELVDDGAKKEEVDYIPNEVD